MRSSERSISDRDIAAIMLEPGGLSDDAVLSEPGFLRACATLPIATRSFWCSTRW